LGRFQDVKRSRAKLTIMFIFSCFNTDQLIYCIFNGFILCLLEMTPLHFASYCGHAEVFEFLANHRDDLGAKTDLGLTALHLACLAGHLEVVKQYANFTKKEERAKEDTFGKYPIHYAAEKGFEKVSS
jgi:hypothetical protein